MEAWRFSQNFESYFAIVLAVHDMRTNVLMCVFQGRTCKKMMRFIHAKKKNAGFGQKNQLIFASLVRYNVYILLFITLLR